MPDLEIFFGDDGRARMLYDDETVPELAEELGRAETRRASNVEPCGEGLWCADMSPSGYPTVLGPFTRRADALAAEVAFLKDRRLEGPK